jgi:hypothetical protein
LLIQKITGELRAGDREFLDDHLMQCPSCIAQEQELAKDWEKFDSLPVPEVPAALYENTRRNILAELRREKAAAPRTLNILMTIRPLLAPLAGLAMTAVSYGVMRPLVHPAVHHHYVLIPLFLVWWLLFAAAFWLILRRQEERFFAFNRIAVFSIAVVALTLVIFLITYEVEAVRWIALSVALELARMSDYLFGIGNTFIAAWWIHCCLASLIGGFIFGLRKGPLSETVFFGSLFITLLLFPAMYLQGSSHNHGYGIIAFAALGAYLASLVGISLGLFIRRQISFQRA